MKKQILNVGTTLNKTEQKSILGGFAGFEDAAGGKLGKGSLCNKYNGKPNQTCKSGLTCKTPHGGISGPLGVCE